MNERRAPSLPLRTALALAAATLLFAVGACQTTPAEPEVVEPPKPLPSLWEAAAEGDIDSLEAHLKAGANLNSLEPQFGVTPLTIAVGSDQSETTRWLLDNGADVNARGGDGGSPLLAAAFLGRAATASILLDAGADTSVRDDNGQTAWDMIALDWQTTSYILDMLQIDMARETLEAGRQEVLALLQPALDAASEDDIWLATASGNIDAVRKLLDGGFDANQRNPDAGVTLLSTAAIVGNADIAMLLLEAGADVNGRNYQNGSTALHAAAFVGQAEMVTLLLDNGADPAAMSDDGSTPLDVTQLDWQTTQYVASMLQLALEEDETMAGKAKAAELIRARL